MRREEKGAEGKEGREERRIEGRKRRREEKGGDGGGGEPHYIQCASCPGSSVQGDWERRQGEPEGNNDINNRTAALPFRTFFPPWVPNSPSRGLAVTKYSIQYIYNISNFSEMRVLQTNSPLTLISSGCVSLWRAPSISCQPDPTRVGPVRARPGRQALLSSTGVKRHGGVTGWWGGGRRLLCKV